MSNRIQILDPFTANQIAAGEVVERPASVVKELVENSLDAGADKIEVEISGAGVELIRVSDNGCGMNREDALMAVQRHATSKIKTPADLARIATLGFRGEALPSIASVSLLEILTRERDSLAGTRVTLIGGKVEKVLEDGCPVGSSFTVRDLFFNTPARRKFLKSDATETGRISEMLSRLALAYPNVAFKFCVEGRVLMQMSGNGSLVEVVSKVFGKELARDMLPISINYEQLALSGLLAKPHHSRSTKAYQFFFVNGRYINSKLLTKAVGDGYHTLMASNRFPVVILNLNIPLNLVDVNVHPTKLEARFSQETVVASFISDSVRTCLQQNTLIPGLNPNAPVAESILKPAESLPIINPPAQMQETQAKWETSTINEIVSKSKTTEEAETVEPEFQTPAELENEPTIAALAIEKASPIEADFTQLELNESCQLDSEEPGQDNGERLPDLLPLGQVNLTYIVARGPQDMYIIDQHAAHERINYERLWELAGTGEIPTQMLLEPLVIELSQQELSVLIENITMFTDLGFLLEYFGGNTFLLRGHPADLSGADHRTLIRDLLELFTDGGKPVEPRKLREEFIYSIACKASVRANESLNVAEMEHLILRLGQTKQPFTCPHGRPTIIAITAAELERRFQRT